MSRARQPDLFAQPQVSRNNRGKKPDTRHGGTHTLGKRKEKRPFDRRLPLHVTLYSSKARGERNLLKARLDRIVRDGFLRWSRHFDVEIEGLANVGSHVHFVIRARRREDFSNFLRTITRVIAQAATGARKGHPTEPENGAGRKFWDYLAFSRVVTWGRDLANVTRYLVKNWIEAAGVTKQDRDYWARYLLANGVVRGGSRRLTSSADHPGSDCGSTRRPMPAIEARRARESRPTATYRRR